MNPFHVIYRESGTSKVLNIETYQDEKQAVKVVREFNQGNQDHTWNCIIAEIECGSGDDPSGWEDDGCRN